MVFFARFVGCSKLSNCYALQRRRSLKPFSIPHLLLSLRYVGGSPVVIAQHQYKNLVEELCYSSSATYQRFSFVVHQKSYGFLKLIIFYFDLDFGWAATFFQFKFKWIFKNTMIKLSSRRFAVVLFFQCLVLLIDLVRHSTTTNA